MDPFLNPLVMDESVIVMTDERGRDECAPGETARFLEKQSSEPRRVIKVKKCKQRQSPNLLVLLEMSAKENWPLFLTANL